MLRIKIIILTALLLFSVPAFSLLLDHGVSIGGISAFGAMDEGMYVVDLVGYRALEINTGLGLSVSALSIISSQDSLDFTDGIYSILPLELNWEPCYPWSSFMGSGFFFRLDNYIPAGEPINWHTGVRHDFRITDINPLAVYPIFTAEAGYWKEKGFYGGIKVDIIALTAFIIYIAAAGAEEKAYDIYDMEPPEDDPSERYPSEYDPEWVWRD